MKYEIVMIFSSKITGEKNGPPPPLKICKNLEHPIQPVHSFNSFKVWVGSCKMKQLGDGIGYNYNSSTPYCQKQMLLRILSYLFLEKMDIRSFFTSTSTSVESSHGSSEDESHSECEDMGDKF